METPIETGNQKKNLSPGQKLIKEHFTKEENQQRVDLDLKVLENTIFQTEKVRQDNLTKKTRVDNE